MTDSGSSTAERTKPHGVIAREVGGVVDVTIVAAHYGDAGGHWKRTLEGPKHNGYGRMFIQRSDSARRRRWHTDDPRQWYVGEKGVNQDECPGAMFIWTTLKAVHVEAVDAIDNQRLGRDMGRALRPYQDGNGDMWEIRFHFV